MRLSRYDDMEFLCASTVTRTRYIAIKPEGSRCIYWTKVLINTLVSLHHIRELAAYRNKFVAKVPHRMIKLRLRVVSDSRSRSSVR
jgi:hypothetical protein